MRTTFKRKGIFLATLLSATMVAPISFAAQTNPTTNGGIRPMITHQLFEHVKSNNNWKLAFATAKNGQIVFMNISPDTNPKNEIGMETHAFDQVIVVVEGDGKADLDGKVTMVKAGDMIFIPQGTHHNVINLNPNKPLKILSFYSSNDIPANTTYKKKADEPQEH